jgi:protein-disulfide isomerase
MSLVIEVNDADQVSGSTDAPVLLVEYGDYECSYCGEAYWTVKKLQKTFGDRLGFIFRNFPLTVIHPYALNAAYIAEAAGLQNKFWQMHDIIFENQQTLAPEQILNLAESLDADIDKLMKDCHSHRIKNKVENDIESGIRAGVNGTPCFFIQGIRYDGDHSFESLQNAVFVLLTGYP